MFYTSLTINLMGISHLQLANQIQDTNHHKHDTIIFSYVTKIQDTK